MFTFGHLFCFLCFVSLAVLRALCCAEPRCCTGRRCYSAGAATHQGTCQRLLVGWRRECESVRVWGVGGLCFSCFVGVHYTEFYHAKFHRAVIRCVHAHGAGGMRALCPVLTPQWDYGHHGAAGGEIITLDCVFMACVV